MVDLPIRIQEKRLEHGFNKTKLGDLLGVSGTAIKQYEDGKNFPKTEVLLAMSEILKWDFVNDKPLESERIFNRNDNITHKENVKENSVNDANNVKQSGFNDINQVDNKIGYSENSSFPERNKPPNELWTLIDNQQKQIKLLHEQNQGIYQQVNLLHQQVEILNKLIKQ